MIEIPKPPKRLNNWPSTRAKIKKIFEANNITCCEKCGNRSFLTFAHSKKRADIKTQKDMEEVALLCQACHRDIEFMSHEAMYNIVTRIISER
jgi:sugar phosphate isomerase/epimerase